MCVCSEPLNSPLIASCWRSNTSFFFVGVVAQHPPGESVPWSMMATCWLFSPWCLRHRHISLRFSLPQLLPSPTHRQAQLYFWMQSLTDHIELQSIFLLLWRSKRALFMCIFVCSVLQLSSTPCDYCSMQSPPLFICLYEFLLSSLLLRPNFHALLLSEKKDDLFCV